MIQVTTPGIEGKRITQCHGIGTGEAILGANILEDFCAGTRDVVGGRSAACENGFRKARQIAPEEMGEEATELGANAIVSIDIDIETVGPRGAKLMVSVNGAADSPIGTAPHRGASGAIVPEE